MSWLSDAIGDVGSAVSSVVGGAASFATSYWSGLGSDISSVASDFSTDLGPALLAVAAFSTGQPELALPALAKIFTSATSSGGSVLSDISSGLNDLTGGAFSDLTSGFSTILSSVSTVISGLTTGVKDIVDPISKDISSITSIVQQLNDSVISPIANLIKAYQDVTTTDINQLTTDINGGIQGFLRLPGDLSNALAGVDAQFSRATQELGDANAAIVKDSLVPGLTAGIGGHVDGITQTLLSPEYESVSGAVFTDLTKLVYPPDTDKALQMVKDLEAKITSSKGFFANLIMQAYDILRTSAYVVEQVAISLEPYMQQARASILATLLSPGEAIEANRRELLSDDDLQTELSLHGIHPDRQTILYNLTNFYFRGREAVELKQKGIITDDEFNLLMSQNNIDPDQATALTELMQHALGPADIAAGVARGYIAADEALNFYQAAFVPERLREIIPELEKTLINPREQIKLIGRATVAQNGFLESSLTSKVPDQIENQYVRTQAEDGLSQLDWLGHWDIPSAAWWCDAYFRGAVTLTQVEQAFQALNIPQELWYNIIDVERELPPVWLVPDIVKTGVWSADQAIPTLMQLGFSQENAQVLYDYGKAASTSTAATTADSLAKLSLGNAKSAFADGIITSDEYTQVLVDHKYSPEAAQLTVEVEEYNLAVAAQKTAAQDVIDQVKLGEINQTQAQSQLYNLGLTTAQVDSWMIKLQSALKAVAKLPSETMIKDMWKKGLITQDQAEQIMELHGYSAQWVPLIIATW